MADDQPETGTEETPETGGDSKKPETGDTAAMAEALRKANKQAATYRKQADDLQKRIEETETASKSDMEKLLAKFDQMEKRAETAEREALVAEVADDMGLSRSQAARLRGTTRDELVADAEQVIEEFGIKPKAKPKPKAADNGDEGGGTETDAAEDGKKDDGKKDAGKPASGKPKEKLQGGATPPGTDDAVDHVKLAKSILDSPF